MSAFESMNREQLLKALGTNRTRINNLETKYGGTIHSGSYEPYRSKMGKLRSEGTAMRERFHSMQDETDHRE